MVNKLKYIFDRKSKITIVLLLIMIIVGSFLEMLGVTVFYPFVELIMDEKSMNGSGLLNYFLDMFVITDHSDKIVFLAILIIVFYIIKNIYLSVMQNEILKFNYNTRMRIATRLLTSYMEEPYTFHLQKNSAELVRTLQVDCNQFMLLLNATLQFIAEVAVCIAIGVYLFSTSPIITIIVGGMLIACVSVYYLVAKKVSLKIGVENQKYNSKLLQWINQALGGIKEVKILERENYFVGEYEKNYKKLTRPAQERPAAAAWA